MRVSGENANRSLKLELYGILVLHLGHVGIDREAVVNVPLLPRHQSHEHLQALNTVYIDKILRSKIGSHWRQKKRQAP